MKARVSAGLKRIRLGMGAQEVRTIVGEPTRVVQFRDTPQKDGIVSAFQFMSTPNGVFPDVGSVYFDADNRVLYSFGYVTPDHRLRDIPGAMLREVLEDIDKMPGLYCNGFDAGSALACARKVRRLPRKVAQLILKEYLRVRPVVSADHQADPVWVESRSPDANDGRLTVLMAVLTGNELLPTSVFDRFLGVRPSRNLKHVQPLMICQHVPVVLTTGVVSQMNVAAEVRVVEKAMKSDWVKIEDIPVLSSLAVRRSAFGDAGKRIRSSGFKQWMVDDMESVVRNELGTCLASHEIGHRLASAGFTLRKYASWGSDSE